MFSEIGQKTFPELRIFGRIRCPRGPDILPSRSIQVPDTSVPWEHGEAGDRVVDAARHGQLDVHVENTIVETERAVWLTNPLHHRPIWHVRVVLPGRMGYVRRNVSLSHVSQSTQVFFQHRHVSLTPWDDLVLMGYRPRILPEIHPEGPVCRRGDRPALDLQLKSQGLIESLLRPEPHHPFVYAWHCIPGHIDCDPDRTRR